MQQTVSGWFLVVTGALACAYHPTIALPLAAALLSGTVLGGWIARHQGAIAVGASTDFIVALAVRATPPLAGKGALAAIAGQRPAGSSDRR
jgi:hypothetical protein